MREKLIEILRKPIFPHELVDPTEAVADYLLDNGVIVLPCKVGDTVWEINAVDPFDEDWRVMESKVEKVLIVTSLDLHCIDNKTLFLTREEAEAALKEENDG